LISVQYGVYKKHFHEMVFTQDRLWKDSEQ